MTETGSDVSFETFVREIAAFLSDKQINFLRDKRLKSSSLINLKWAFGNEVN